MYNYLYTCNYLLHLCGGPTDEGEDDGDGDAMRMTTATDVCFSSRLALVPRPRGGRAPRAVPAQSKAATAACLVLAPPPA